jgi:hypothetical protein
MIVPWVLLGVAVLALASAIWPRWVRVFRPTPSRVPGAPIHAFHVWPVRAVSVAIVAGIAAYAVRTLWPDDGQRDLVGLGAVLVVGIGLSIWVLASIVSRRDRESHGYTVDEELDEASAESDAIGVPRRIVSPGYRFEYASLTVALLTVLVAGVSFAGIADDDPAAEADPAPAETLNTTDEVLKRLNTLHVPLTVLDAAPATGDVIDAWWYAPVDVELRLPYAAWHQAEPPAPYTAAQVLAGSDLVLRLPGWHCVAVGMIVIETETTVTIGIAVTENPPTPAPTETLGPDGIPTPPPTPASEPLDLTCVSISVVNNHWFPVDLAAPLGDREVLNFGGRHIGMYQPPIDYSVDDEAE